MANEATHLRVVADNTVEGGVEITGAAPILTPYPAHGGGGGGGPVEPKIPLKDYVDAADNAVESRLMAKLDNIPTKGTFWAGIATLIATVLAILAFGGDRFDGGLGLSSELDRINENQAATDAAQNARFDELVQKLDVIIAQTEPPAK